MYRTIDYFTVREEAHLAATIRFLAMYDGTLIKTFLGHDSSIEKSGQLEDRSLDIKKTFTAFSEKRFIVFWFLNEKSYSVFVQPSEQYITSLITMNVHADTLVFR